MKNPIKVIGSIRRVRDASGAEMVLAEICMQGHGTIIPGEDNMPES
jgi:hypothetical protein